MRVVATPRNSATHWTIRAAQPRRGRRRSGVQPGVRRCRVGVGRRVSSWTPGASEGGTPGAWAKCWSCGRVPPGKSTHVICETQDVVWATGHRRQWRPGGGAGARLRVQGRRRRHSPRCARRGCRPRSTARSAGATRAGSRTCCPPRPWSSAPSARPRSTTSRWTAGSSRPTSSRRPRRSTCSRRRPRRTRGWPPSTASRSTGCSPMGT